MGEAKKAPTEKTLGEAKKAPTEKALGEAKKAPTVKAKAGLVYTPLKSRRLFKSEYFNSFVAATLKKGRNRI